MQDYKNINFHCANEGRLRGEKIVEFNISKIYLLWTMRDGLKDQNIENKILKKKSYLIPSLRVLQ